MKQVQPQYLQLQFVNDVLPLPFREMMSEVLQIRQDNELAQEGLTNLQKMLLLGSGNQSLDKAYADKTLGEFQPILEGIRSGLMSISDPTVQLLIKRQIRSIDYAGLADLLNTKTQLQELTKLQLDLRKQGKYYDARHDRDVRGADIVNMTPEERDEFFALGNYMDLAEFEGIINKNVKPGFIRKDGLYGQIEGISEDMVKFGKDGDRLLLEQHWNDLATKEMYSALKLANDKLPEDQRKKDSEIRDLVANEYIDKYFNPQAKTRTFEKKEVDQLAATNRQMYLQEKNIKIREDHNKAMEEIKRNGSGRSDKDRPVAIEKSTLVSIYNNNVEMLKASIDKINANTTLSPEAKKALIDKIKLSVDAETTISAAPDQVLKEFGVDDRLFDLGGNVALRINSLDKVDIPVILDKPEFAKWLNEFVSKTSAFVSTGNTYRLSNGKMINTGNTKLFIPKNEVDAFLAKLEPEQLAAINLQLKEFAESQPIAVKDLTKTLMGSSSDFTYNLLQAQQFYTIDVASLSNDPEDVPIERSKPVKRGDVIDYIPQQIDY